MSSVWLALAVGVLVGIISGLVGIGGGVIMVPIFVYGFKMDQPMAKGTALIFDMKVKGFDIHGEGKVVAQHPGVGMAVHFVHFAPEDEKKLNELLKLLQSQEAQQGGVIITP